uniref:Tc1-like transposase DDE domain-containing protein n=1 Tax=Esox lucius TaxID=8010 RepID=A0AAY5L5H5_ESOLU
MTKELKRKALSEEKKGSILALLAEGCSERQVASILKISKTAVHKNKVKQQTLGTTELQTGRGRKRLSTARDDRQLIRMSLNNRRMTSSDLQKEWQTTSGVKCTVRTVRNRLLMAGLKLCKARKKPFINEEQRSARLKFAKDHKDWTIEEWSKVIFSDKSNFQLCPTPGHLMVGWRPGEAYQPQYLAPTVKFGGGSVTIWGCFSKAGIGQICLCEGRMNQAKYKVILEEHLLPSALKMFPNSENWFFQQDNAPCHTARSIKVWMEDHQIKTLSWPAQSPDLNPIENLWNLMKRKMDGHKPSNKAELLEFLCQEWNKVTQQQCDRLVESMPRRIKAVIKNQGYSTKYWFLNSS